MNIAFYAPLKPPDHPVPSGDRLMARLLIAAMQRAGHDVQVASHLRGFSKSPETPELHAAARAEIERLRRAWLQRAPGQRPDLWFCYHPYFRAPDLIGPELSHNLRIPYVTAEASYAGKRERDEWHALQQHVRNALERSAVNFCMTGIDLEGIEPIVGSERIVELPPFIDTAPFTGQPARGNRRALRLTAVAMMRSGSKLDSYRFLADALLELAAEDWQLDIVGDGPARHEVEKAFSPLAADRIAWRGECNAAQVRSLLAESDIFVWPGIGEAYGLAYLEAQASGLPVVALNTHGVPYVVDSGKTGLLTPPGELKAYAAAIGKLLRNDEMRLKLARTARETVMKKRSLAKASEILDAGLRFAVSRGAAS